VLAVPLAAVSLAATRPCSRATAVAVVRSTKLKVPASQSISDQAYRVSPRDVDGAICISLPMGQKAMVVTVGSGGTAGDVDWAIYVTGSEGWTLSLIRGGYKLGLVRKGADIVETDPIYKKNDPNCCPSGGFAHRRWHWNGSEFLVVRTWHDSHYQE
jgi:hypothetical protein